MPAANADYRVKLDAFEGPLDLLLFLTRKAEVDIADIPIATITEQYLESLKDIERIDMDLAGEFLVMAATLTELKSRMFQPRIEGQTRDIAPTSPEDPRAELVRQLLEYKQYRDAADSLQRRLNDWQRRYPAAPVARTEPVLTSDSGDSSDSDSSESPAEIDDLEVVDLLSAFKRIIESVNFDRMGDHTVTYDDTPIELHAEDVLDHLRREAGESGEIEFSRVFDGRDRAEMIGLFLALLDLVRRQAVRVRQDRIEGQILLGLRPETPAAVVPEAAPTTS